MIYCSSSFIWEMEWGAVIVLQLYRSYWKHYLIFICQNGFISVLPYVNNMLFYQLLSLHFKSKCSLSLIAAEHLQ